jgi:uncharacterized protein (TIGR02646 family)
MRRFHRTSLPAGAAKYLERKQKEVDGGKDPRRTWEYARSTQAMRQVEKTLKQMAGRRERCMFCGDSRGTDIDHFWPLGRYRNRTFVWLNLLWSCTACNRYKLDKFALDEHGRPLLIDPTAEDPWDFLFYDRQTDNITARYDPARRDFNPRGTFTVEALAALTYEAVTDGRRRARRHLESAIKLFLNKAIQGVDGAARMELLESIRDSDEYGLVQWYFMREGREESPFLDLRREHPSLWEEIVEELSPTGTLGK